MGRSRKPLWASVHRGFESLPPRHTERVCKGAFLFPPSAFIEKMKFESLPPRYTERVCNGAFLFPPSAFIEKMVFESLPPRYTERVCNGAFFSTERLHEVTTDDCLR
jgi:hypothetical protein